MWSATAPLGVQVVGREGCLKQDCVKPLFAADFTFPRVAAGGWGWGGVLAVEGGGRARTDGEEEMRRRRWGRSRLAEGPSVPLQLTSCRKRLVRALPPACLLSSVRFFMCVLMWGSCEFSVTAPFACRFTRCHDLRNAHGPNLVLIGAERDKSLTPKAPSVQLPPSPSNRRHRSRRHINAKPPAHGNRSG